MSRQLRFSANINMFNAAADKRVLDGYGQGLSSEELTAAATRVVALDCVGWSASGT